MVNTKVQRPKVSSLFIWDRSKMLISILDEKWPLWMVAMAFSERVFRPDGGFGNMAGFLRQLLLAPTWRRSWSTCWAAAASAPWLSRPATIPRNSCFGKSCSLISWNIQDCVAYYSIRQRFFSISKFLKIVPLSYWLDLVLENGHPEFSLAHCFSFDLRFAKENKL